MNVLWLANRLPEETLAMRPRTFLALLSLTPLGVVLLFSVSCIKSPTAPDETSNTPIAAGDGQIYFVDSGCACVNPPYPSISITIDSKPAGTLPIFGHLAVNLPPGPHTWSDDSGDGPTQFTITQGKVMTVNVFTNLDCGDSCPTDDSQVH